LTTFQDFGLAAPLLKALAAEGYDTPTPIQSQAIPIAMTGSDIVGLAQTGTGKTAAFALPILHRLQAAGGRPEPKTCRVLVLAPTRELASQIAASFEAYGRHMKLSVAVVFGGVPLGRQREQLSRGVDVLVATPGRLIDHVENRAVRLDAVSMFVLDEADHMMDMGFIHALRRIAKLLPAKRQSLFFSATMPPEIASLAEQFLTDPQKVAVTPVSSTAERVSQGVIHIASDQKGVLLDALLNERPEIDRAIVFTRMKHGADRVVSALRANGHEAEAIHGNKSQAQRERALAAFKAGRVRLLVATEIAARGIDIDEVSHVINYDLPNVPEQYVHRIGRTARAGADGQAISFCAPDERAWLRDIEKLTKMPVEVIEHPLALPTPGPKDPIPKPPPIGGRGQGRGQQQQRSQPSRRDQPRQERGERQESRSGDKSRRPDRARDDRPRTDDRRQDRPRQDDRRQEMRSEKPRSSDNRGGDNRGGGNGARGAGKPHKARNGKTYQTRSDAVWSNQD
jgi:ATP-dependent RNA helicase RhlE